MVTRADPGDERTYRYTCFQHAFDLITPSRDIVAIATLYPHVFPSAEFVAYLTQKWLTEVLPADVTDGDVVIYYSGDVARHAGRVHSGAVISKWGTAHLWRHGLFEVPTTYGNRTRFFQPLAQSRAENAFLDYGHEVHGIRL